MESEGANSSGEEKNEDLTQEEEQSQIESERLKGPPEDLPKSEPEALTETEAGALEKTELEGLEETEEEALGETEAGALEETELEGLEETEEEALEEAETEALEEIEPEALEEPALNLLEIVGGDVSPMAFPCTDFLNKRSPFIHDPPEPEERRSRIQNPRTPKEYIINLREDLADYQESHGVPRTRDYSFLTLGLALLQETATAIYSLFLMFKELFPIVAIMSLLLRFTLDKLIEILETEEAVPKLKKSIIFALELLLIVVPLWILLTSIILPLLSLVLSLLKSVFRFHSGKKCGKQKQSSHKSHCFALF